MLYMNEAEVKTYLEQVIRFVAQKLGINLDVEDNVSEAIKTGHPIIAGKLNEFIEAYNAWYKFHFERHQKNIIEPCDIAECQILQMLIDKRDNTRTDLINATQSQNETEQVFRQKEHEENSFDVDALHEKAQKNKVLGKTSIKI